MFPGCLPQPFAVTRLESEICYNALIQTVGPGEVPQTSRFNSLADGATNKVQLRAKKHFHGVSYQERYALLWLRLTTHMFGSITLEPTMAERVGRGTLTGTWKPRQGFCPNIRGGITIERDLPANTKLWLTGWTKTVPGGEVVSSSWRLPTKMGGRANVDETFNRPRR